jgi:hypothetical protein
MILFSGGGYDIGGGGEEIEDFGMRISDLLHIFGNLEGDLQPATCNISFLVDV